MVSEGNTLTIFKVAKERCFNVATDWGFKGMLILLGALMLVYRLALSILLSLYKINKPQECGHARVWRGTILYYYS